MVIVEQVKKNLLRILIGEAEKVFLSPSCRSL